MRRGPVVALLLLSAAAGADEPTPFWMPPPPPAREQAPARPAKKPVRKKPVQIEPLQIKRKEKPPVVEKRRAREPEPGWIAPPPRSPAPEAAEPGPRATEPPPRAKRAPIEVEPSPQPPRAPAARVPAPPLPEAPPAVVQPAPLRPAPAAPAPAGTPAAEQPASAVMAEPEPEPQGDDARRWSVDAAFGLWGKARSDGGGRDWQPAYGLRFGRALFPSLELEVALLRAGGSAGSPFVSASATHNLAALRAFWVLGDQVALLLGGGAGVALSQTHYTLQPSTDATVPPTGLDATAFKSVIEITAAARARIFRGLEVRAEVSAAARDGKLEILPLLGAGAAF